MMAILCLASMMDCDPFDAICPKLIDTAWPRERAGQGLDLLLLQTRPRAEKMDRLAAKVIAPMHAQSGVAEPVIAD